MPEWSYCADDQLRWQFPTATANKEISKISSPTKSLRLPKVLLGVYRSPDTLVDPVDLPLSARVKIERGSGRVIFRAFPGTTHTHSHTKGCKLPAARATGSRLSLLWDRPSSITWVAASTGVGGARIHSHTGPRWWIEWFFSTFSFIYVFVFIKDKQDNNNKFIICQ